MNNMLAENIAIKAFEYLVKNEEYFGNFLNYSGTSIEDLKLSAENIAFKISVLNFICHDEVLLISFCESCNIPPSEPYQAFQYLEYYN